MDRTKLQGLLGICRKSGRLTAGGAQALEAVRGRKKPYLVLLASDASDNTKKALHNGCTFYGIPYETLPMGKAELGALLGKSGVVAAVAVLDEGFAKAMQQTYAAGND